MARDPKPIARARVTVTVEVDCVGPWGPDATVSQVHDQAGREAVKAMERLLASSRGVHVVREPKVNVIIWSKNDDE